MIKIGITGGIGSGKSYVSKLFRTYDIPVFDCDTIASNLILEDIEAMDLVQSLYGNHMYYEDTNGKIRVNREALSISIFEDKYALNHFNNMLAPIVMKKINCLCNNVTAPYVIIESAILYETYMDKYMDKVLGIYTDIEVRIKRVIDRSGLSRSEIIKRMNCQMSDLDKLKLYDIVINNTNNKILKSTIHNMHGYFMTLKNEK